MLLVGQGGDPLRGHGFGNLLMVLNGLSYAVFLVISKQLVSRYPSLVVIAWVYILALPYLPYFVRGEKLLADAGQSTAWWSLAYIIVFPTVLAYLLNMFALARVRATTTAVYIYCQPLVAGVAGRRGPSQLAALRRRSGPLRGRRIRVQDPVVEDTCTPRGRVP